MDYPGPAQNRRPVVFGPPRELTELAVTKDCGSVGSKTADVHTTTLTFNVNLSGCFIYPAPDGFDYLAVEDLEPFTERYAPQLPMKTFIVSLDKNAEVHGAEVVGGTYREVQQPVRIVPVPWDARYKPDKELYQTKTFFPGKLLGYERGNDNQKQHVFVRFCPLQYVPGERKAFLVTKATLNLYWSHPAESVGARDAKTLALGQRTGGRIADPEAECVILCPEALQQQASRLSQFHTAAEGIRPSVVTTEAIAAVYQSASDPPFNGYTNRQLAGWGSITNYKYALAKKIVYTCEMGCEEAIRQGLFDGMNVKRFYQSADRLEQPYIEPLLTTLGVGIFYYSSHGSVSSLASRIQIEAADVMRYSANDRVPVVFADACSTSAFDLDLVNHGCHLSFGEALLKSPAGGIAVFGASRLTFSDRLFYYNQERPVFAKLGGMQGLMHYALKSYRAGSDTLGKLSSDALYSYITNNSLAYSGGNKLIVFAFVLLGDPALKIPVHQGR